jgi:hypothetical protein
MCRTCTTVMSTCACHHARWTTASYLEVVTQVKGYLASSEEFNVHPEDQTLIDFNAKRHVIGGCIIGG